MPERVGVPKRAVALIIDAILIGIGGTVSGAVLGGLLGTAAGGIAGAAGGTENVAASATVGGFIGVIAGVAIGVTVIGVVYNLIEGFTGASPGKMLLGIKIGNADGTTAELSTLLYRYAIKNVGLLSGSLGFAVGISVLRSLSGLLGLIVFVGYFFAFGVAKQALHDVIAKTAVYEKAALH